MNFPKVSEAERTAMIALYQEVADAIKAAREIGAITLFNQFQDRMDRERFEEIIKHFVFSGYVYKSPADPSWGERWVPGRTAWTPLDQRHTLRWIGNMTVVFK